MPWNYRVVKTTGVQNDTPWEALEIRSAFYENGADPDSKPKSIGSEAVKVVTDAENPIEDLKRDLEKMLRALTMPIINASDYD